MQVATDAQTRKVKENSPSGTAVGKPVTAGDAGDILTYTLDWDKCELVTASTGPPARSWLGPSAESLRAWKQKKTDQDTFQLQVTVRATDPYGDPDIEDAVDTNSDTVTVTITVENVNESPTITRGPTRDSQAENEDTEIPQHDGIQISPPSPTR